MADLGVHRIGKVDGRGARTEHLHLAGRREDEDLAVVQVDLHGFEELLGVGQVVLLGPVERAPQPCELVVEALRGALLVAVGVARLLVEPVGGNAVLGVLVHLLGADLHLEGAARRTDDRGVQRLVHVELGHCDVVFEAPGHGRPQGVDGSENAVALTHVVGDDAQRNEVVDLAEVLTLVLHLHIDGVEVLGPAHDAEMLDLGLRELVAQDGLDRLQVRLALGARLGHHARDLAVLRGIQVEERQVLKLPLDGADAQAVCQGRVDAHRLVGLEDAAVLRDGHERAHVVQAVGQLDDDDADVLGHGEEHLAQVERLLLGQARHGDVRELRHAVNQLGDLGPKELGELIERGIGVFDGVMEKARAQHVNVGVEVLRQDDGDFHRVVDVRLARLALLVAMVGARKLIGALNLLHLVGAQVGSGAFAQHGEVVQLPLRREGRRGGVVLCVDDGVSHGNAPPGVPRF